MKQGSLPLPTYGLTDVSEYFVCPLLWGRLILRHLHDAADHLVDGCNDLQRFMPGDEAVPVQVLLTHNPKACMTHLAQLWAY